MSGHSKWSTIKHKKAAQDARRGDVFTKLAKAIAVAVKQGGSGEPEFNFSLRLAIEKARGANMPNANIERAIEHGLGKGEGGELEEFTLEGYGPGGVAVIVEAVSDNRNRTVSEVKTMFDKAGGNLGEPGSVKYLFSRVGRVGYGGELREEDTLALIEKEVSDLREERGGGEVVTKLGQEAEIGEFLQKQGYTPVEVGVEYRANSTVEGQGRERIEEFLGKLAEHDDVQEVYANLS